MKPRRSECYIKHFFQFWGEFQCASHTEQKMLNMNNIPEQQISGLDSNVLDWVSFQSSERCVNEISPEFLNYLNREEDPMTIEELTTEIIAEMNATEKNQFLRQH